MEVVKEVSPTGGLYYGHTKVGVEAIQLCGDFDTRRGVLLRCPGSLDPVPNTAAIWIGGKNVKADSSAAGGMPIPPGSHLVLPVDDPSQLYVISTIADQDIAWMGV